MEPYDGISLWFAFPLRTNDAENISRCLLAISTSSLEKYLFKSFAHFLFSFSLPFKIVLFVFLLLSCRNYSYIRDMKTLPDTRFAGVFSAILQVVVSLSLDDVF